MSKQRRPRLFKPKIFVSHTKWVVPKIGKRRKDPNVTRALAGLRKQGLSFFVDKQIRPGEIWGARLYKELRTCHGGLILASAGAKASDWMKIEATILRYRQQHESRFPLVVVPLDRVFENSGARRKLFPSLELDKYQWATSVPDATDSLLESIEAEGPSEESFDQVLSVCYRRSGSGFQFRVSKNKSRQYLMYPKGETHRFEGLLERAKEVARKEGGVKPKRGGTTRVPGLPERWPFATIIWRKRAYPNRLTAVMLLECEASGKKTGRRPAWLKPKEAVRRLEAEGGKNRRELVRITRLAHNLLTTKS